MTNQPQEKETINFLIGKGYKDKFGDNYIKLNDHKFEEVKYDRDFLKANSGVIQQIDKAQIIDYNLLTIITPYGTTSVSDFSTGLKTVLNTLYLARKKTSESFLMSLNECGDKIVNFILRIKGIKNVSFTIERTIMLEPKIFGKFQVMVNGNEVKDTMSFMKFMMDYTEKELNSMVKS